MDTFINAARNVGAEVMVASDLNEVIAYIKERASGSVMLPPCVSLARVGLLEKCREAGLNVVDNDFRKHGAEAAAGVTGANFAFAETGTVALESTDEAVRIATTLPEKHFVLLDPRKILASADEAVPLLEKIHADMPQAYLAYITGPSRTADIERVLTIGVHGPAELHILLLDGLSDDVMER